MSEIEEQAKAAVALGLDADDLATLAKHPTLTPEELRVCKGMHIAPADYIAARDRDKPSELDAEVERQRVAALMDEARRKSGR